MAKPSRRCFALSIIIMFPDDGTFGPDVTIGWPNRFLLLAYWAASKRNLIEGVIEQLKDLFALERHRAKTLSDTATPGARQTPVA